MSQHLVNARETWRFILSKPEELSDTLCLHVALGGTLRSLAKNWGVPYPWVYRHVIASSELNKKYQESLIEQKQYMLDLILDQYHELAGSDIRDLAKIKALEQLAKHFGFVDKSEDAGKLTWEAVLQQVLARRGDRAAGQIEAKEVIPIKDEKK